MWYNKQKVNANRWGFMVANWWISVEYLSIFKYTREKTVIGKAKEKKTFTQNLFKTSPILDRNFKQKAIFEQRVYSTILLGDKIWCFFVLSLNQHDVIVNDEDVISFFFVSHHHFML